MSDTRIIRILDAAMNRAGEGLRVVEDYLRFALDDRQLVAEAKMLRHELADAARRIETADRHAARDTANDVGTGISTSAEQNRSDAWAVCAASLKRTEQALRSAEEYGKLVDGGFARSVEALRYRVYTLEKVIDIGRSSRERLAGVRLCVLVDGRRSSDEFEQLVGALIKAGVGMIQLRDKSLDDRELVGRARTLVELTRRQPLAEPGAARLQPSRPLAVVNDRADIAAAADADGVHVGQEDMSVADVRAVVGTGMLVGVSTHNIEQARTAVLDGANYLGAGPTFASRTKEFAAFAGLAYLREVAAETGLPTFAIGGISADGLPEVLATGITRVAVGAAVTEAVAPHSAARELLSILNCPAARVASPNRNHGTRRAVT